VNDERIADYLDWIDRELDYLSGEELAA